MGDFQSSNLAWAPKKSRLVSHLDENRFENQLLPHSRGLEVVGSLPAHGKMGQKGIDCGLAVLGFNHFIDLYLLYKH